MRFLMVRIVFLVQSVVVIRDRRRPSSIASVTIVACSIGCWSAGCILLARSGTVAGRETLGRSIGRAIVIGLALDSSNKTARSTIGVSIERSSTTTTSGVSIASSSIAIAAARSIGSITTSSGLSITMRLTCQLHQLRTDRLIGFTKNTNQLVSLLGVVHRKERVGSALLIATTGTADAMHIVLGTVRIVKVDHVLDVVHVYSKQKKRLVLDEPETFLTKESCSIWIVFQCLFQCLLWMLSTT